MVLLLRQPFSHLLVKLGEQRGELADMFFVPRICCRLTLCQFIREVPVAFDKAGVERFGFLSQFIQPLARGFERLLVDAADPRHGGRKIGFQPADRTLPGGYGGRLAIAHGAGHVGAFIAQSVEPRAERGEALGFLRVQCRG